MGGNAKIGSIDFADLILLLLHSNLKTYDESDETEGIRGIDFGEGTVGAGSGAALELELFHQG